MFVNSISKKNISTSLSKKKSIIIRQKNYFFKLLSCFIFSTILSSNLYSQVGINTEDPKATLDVKASSESISAIDGIIAPRLTGDELLKKNNLYTSEQTGALIYALSASSNVDIDDDKTAHVTGPGYYYFDGDKWNPIRSGLTKPNTSNGLSVSKDTIQLGGVLQKPTTIGGITNVNKLSFEASGSHAIHVNDTVFSIDASKGRIGIGTDSPAETLDIDGSLRLSPLKEINKQPALSTGNMPLYVNGTTGKVTYAPSGFTSVTGGFRPGSSYLLRKLSKTNTIVRVRFLCYIDSSSESLNAETESYVFGDLTIVGTGSTDPIKFVWLDIKGYDGKPKTLISNTPTLISWNIGESQGITELSLNQTTGDFKIRNYKPSTQVESPILSYYFEFLGAK